MKIYERKFKEKYEKDYGVFEKINESSLSRIWKHSKNGFFMMSAFRGDDFDKNMANHKRLKADLKQNNLGFFEIDGQYKYDNGDIESELSVFVPYRDIYSFEEFKNISKKLGKKYNQESILVKYPEELDNKAVLLYPKSGKEEVIGNKVGYDKVSFAYSKLRKGSHKDRSFIIEGVRVPSNHISAYQLKSENILF